MRPLCACRLTPALPLAFTCAAAGHFPVQVKKRAWAHAGLILHPPLPQSHAQHQWQRQPPGFQSAARQCVMCAAAVFPPRQHHPSAFFPLAGRRALRPLIVTPNSICSCHSSPERTMNIQGLLGGNVWQMLGTIQLVYTKLVVQARQARQAARLMPADCNWIWPHVRCPRCPPAAAR